MRFLISFLFLLGSFGLFAQQTGSLTVCGKVKYKRSTLNQVNIEVYKDNELLREFQNLKNGGFKLSLPLGAVYNVTYSKPGYIQKAVAVVAKLDSTQKINGRYFFQLDIELFKEDEEAVDESILPPVAKLYIKNQTTGFTFDKKYVKWVAGKYEDEAEKK